MPTLQVKSLKFVTMFQNCYLVDNYCSAIEDVKSIKAMCMRKMHVQVETKNQSEIDGFGFFFYRLSARQRSLSTTSVAKGYSPRYQYVGYFPNHNSSECEYAHMLQVHGRNTPQIDVIGYTPDTADSSPSRKDRDIYQTSPLRKGRTLCEPNCGKIESIYVTSQCPLESTHLTSRGMQRPD